MKKSLLLLAILLFTGSYVLLSQGLWENLKLPNKSISVTAVHYEGNKIFIGTSLNGLYVTSDNGSTWTDISLILMKSDTLTAIYRSASNTLFVAGMRRIYKTIDNGANWYVYSILIEKGEFLHCFNVSLQGNIFLGSDKSVYKSDKSNDGYAYSVISRDIDPIDTKSLIADAHEYIFVSGKTAEGRYSIFRYESERAGWVTNNNGIRTEAKVSQFVLKNDVDLYAVVDSTIYSYDYASKKWVEFISDDEDRIIKIAFGSGGQLVTLGPRDIKIYQRGSKKGVKVSEINAADVTDICITTGNRIVAVTRDSFLETSVDIDNVVDWVLSWRYRILDSKGDNCVNIKFNLYKATCDNDQVFLKEVTTDNNGCIVLNLNTYNLKIGDRLKVEKRIHIQPTVKSGHEAVGNVLYEIFINNCEYDSLGFVSYHEITTEMNEDIQLKNVVIKANLVISVEWDAKKAYLDSLASWVRYMSDYYYDVSDGQFIIDRVAIYDKSKKWDQADIRIFASNQVWPNSSVDATGKFDTCQAQVRMPRRFFGNDDDNRKITNQPDWYQIDEKKYLLFTSSTIAHELGHYFMGFYDEYLYADEYKAKYLPTGYNYGYMDYQYMNGDEYSSEFSNIKRYPNSDYKITYQWYYHSMDCWSFFESRFENYYTSGGRVFFADILKPSERHLAKGFNYLRGPNDFMTKQNTCSVADMTQIQIFDIDANAGDFTFTVYDEQGNPAKKAYVMLSHDYSLITIKKPDQGCTADNGKMIVVGANVGDKVTTIQTKKIYIPFYGYVDFPYFGELTIGAVTLNDKESDETLDDEVKLVLQPIKGSFELINNLFYETNGNLNLDSYTEKAFAGEFSTTLPADSDTLKKISSRFSENENTYKTILGKLSLERGTILLNVEDSAGKKFVIPVPYSQSPTAYNNYSPDGAVELLHEGASRGISRIAFASCDFPPSRNGLRGDQERSGAVHSISTFPIPLNEIGNFLTLRYTASDLIDHSPLDLRIFKWNTDRKTWLLVGGLVDTVKKLVSSPVDGTGIYALFTLHDPSGLNDDELPDDINLRISPNPSDRNCSISFYLDNPAECKISVCNILGYDILKLNDLNLQHGKNRIEVNTSSFENGVYFIKLNYKGRFITEKLVISR